MTAALPSTPNVNRFKWLACVAALMTYLLIVGGGMVRVTGAGLACGSDWPLCQGRVFLARDWPTFINSLHRLTTLLAALLILGLAFEAGRGYRRVRWVVWPALGALAALVAEIFLGAATVRAALNPALTVLHLATALILLALLLIVTVVAFQLNSNPHLGEALLHFDAVSRLAGAATLGVFGVIVAGALVTATRAASACPDWPLCAGAMTPSSVAGLIHMGHRYLVGAVGLLVVAAVMRAWQLRRAATPVIGAATLAGAGFVAQVLGGAEQVQRGNPAFLAGAHLALAAAVWAGMVVFAVLAMQYVQLSPLKFAVPAPARRARMVTAFWDIIRAPQSAFTDPD